jgi:hypothetical protein
MLLRVAFLPCVRLEWLVLFDAESLEHGHHEPVALLHGFLIDDVGESLPICEAARLRLGPDFSPRSEKPLFRRIGPRAVRVEANFIDPLLRLGRIRIEGAEARPYIRCGRAHDDIARNVRRLRLAGSNDEVFGSLAFVRSCLPHVRDGALPKIENAAGVRPSR